MQCGHKKCASDDDLRGKPGEGDQAASDWRRSAFRSGTTGLSRDSIHLERPETILLVDAALIPLLQDNVWPRALMSRTVPQKNHSKFFYEASHVQEICRQNRHSSARARYGLFCIRHKNPCAGMCCSALQPARAE